MPGAERAGRAVQDVRVVGRYDHGQRCLAAVAGLQRRQHAGPVQTRHDPVDQQQVIGPLVLLRALNHGQRGIAVVGIVDTAAPGCPYTQGTQQIRQGQAGIGLVVHHQHPHTVGARQWCSGQRGRFGKWKTGREVETGALRGYAFDPDPSTHEFDDPLGDGQTQAGAAVLAGGGAIGLRELLEQPPDLRRRHADTGVAHAEAQGHAVFIGVFDLDHQFHVAMVRELHRIRQQVGQYLPQAQGVAHERAAFTQQARLGDVEQQLDIFFVGALAQQRQGLSRHILDPETAFLKLQFAGLDFREIQDVVDDAQQRARGVVDLAHIVMLARIELGFEGQIRHAQDRVHGGADLVAHIGQEHRLGVGCVFCLPTCCLQFLLYRMAAVDVVFDRLRH